MIVEGLEAAAARPADEGLVDLAAAGSADAFDRLVGARLDRLFRMAVAILRSETDARDAVQEACVHAWRELPRLRDRARFDSWLNQILVNDCRAILRRAKRTRIREIDVETMPDEGGSSGSATAPSAVDAVAEAEAIRRAFERLDAPARTLIVLHYVEERPLAEIAAAMQAPVGTIKWRLSNARRALDAALEVERR
jgi:RNA polymerase sigma-70 factor (ECF subfamily)